MGIRQRLHRLLVYFSVKCIVQKKVKLDGEICLDSVSAITRAMERRLITPALLP